MIISNLDEMKEHLAYIKSQASSWLSSSDGSYEACLHDKGYYSIIWGRAMNFAMHTALMILALTNVVLFTILVLVC